MKTSACASILAVLLYAGVARAADEGRKGLDVAKAFRDCALVEKIDVAHGGTLTDHGREAANSCMMLALAYEDGDIVDTGTGETIAVNYKLAMRYYTVACKSTITLACVSIAQMYQKGRIPTKKGVDAEGEAIKWYLYGCYKAGGDKEVIRMSCSLAGSYMFNLAIEKQGKVRPKNFRNLMLEALKTSQYACELGDDSSCRLLAKIEQITSEDK